ncbi:sugar O-acyltransferase, sialic acid O-acetyltransferase NeuD family [Flavobacterium sp. CF108]|uniref:PglD-related sugar-binding protein n=1 Tax=unclassified Flavobacterium TaxID=196869 RepID=UPI0008B342AC|nr:MULTISPECIES: sialic acid O-acetyltransferase [unclassified Flavobacterium]SEO86964.1 sugar O-acyltransferase, sialic acid O-acetyltransferase NeuD family [Flavobacterium sp. fv08]SHG68373.1 sugar O-acyltransferase, sialic acid O-acetyltransferase NeuD family [Flavobacterium sp. CF108]
MKNLIIIGARGYGREVCGLARQCSGYNTEYTIKGFLDDKLDALDGFENYPAIISSVENYEIQDNDVFVCALGSVQWKKHYVEIILSKGGQFINLIHPTVVFTSNVKLGNGIIVFMYSNISNDCVLDDFVTIQGFVAIGHDSKIGKWCHINAYSFTGGYAVLEEEVCLNTRATVLPNIIVRKGATVGAASLVIKNVKENTTVFGVPAKKMDF